MPVLGSDVNEIYGVLISVVHFLYNMILNTLACFCSGIYQVGSHLF